MVVNYKGPGTYLLIDVKTFDGSGATHVAHDHTNRVRLAAHVAEERRCRSQDYRVTAASPLPQGMSLVVFTVSTLGTLGPEAAKLVAALSHRNSGNVPGSLLDAASWACPRLGPFLRQAVGLAARRGLARAVNETYRTVPVAPLLVPAVRVVGPAAAQAYFLEFPALPAAVAGPAGPAPAPVVP